MTEHNNNKRSARTIRGQIPAGFEKKFEACSPQDLILLLAHENAQIRTAAATLLGQQKCAEAVPNLCKQLAKESALYPRIAQSKALGEIGLPALPHLINLIGKIGKNQHQALPRKPFRKWNYPLPRDIAIRTIVKIGPKALPEILKTLNDGSDPIIVAECVDAVGHISYYSADQQGYKTLTSLYPQCTDQPVIQWKIIRAFQAFPREETLAFLQEVLQTSPIPQHRWEAARSLGQIATPRAEQILQAIKAEQHPLVIEMLQRSLDHINHNTYLPN